MGFPKTEKAREAISSKIQKLMGEGRKKDQAIAIAISMAKKKK